MTSIHLCTHLVHDGGIQWKAIRTQKRPSDIFSWWSCHKQMKIYCLIMLCLMGKVHKKQIFNLESSNEGLTKLFKHHSPFPECQNVHAPNWEMKTEQKHLLPQSMHQKSLFFIHQKSLVITCIPYSTYTLSMSSLPHLTDFDLMTWTTTREAPTLKIEEIWRFHNLKIATVAAA